MLTHLIQLLSEAENGLSLAEMSRAMNAQPSAVFAMLQTLVHKGRIVEVGPDGGICASCGLEAQCNLLATRGKRYVLLVPTARLQGAVN